jgi:hypothetical protein
MARKTGCLLAVFASVLALVIFIYGFDPWFRPGITIKKLAKQNPTSFVFRASVDEIQRALRNKAVRCCGLAVEFKDHTFFSNGLLDLPGNGNDAYIHNFHQPIGPSAVYFSADDPLPYLCEFQLHLIPISQGETRVVVIPRKAEVIYGRSWWGPHNFSPANLYRDVSPTTVEEYRILLELGTALGADNMPLLQLPTAAGGS